MKRLLSLLIALIVAMVPLSALAAPGDATLLRRGDEGYDGGVRSMAYLDDTLYILSYNALFVLAPGADKPALYAWDEESSQPSEGANIDRQALIVHDGQLLALCVETRWIVEDAETGEGETELIGANLRKIALGEDGTARGEVALELDWEDMLEEENDYSYVRQCQQPFVVDGLMYFITYGNSGGTMIMVYDLEDGTGREIDLEIDSEEYINCLCAYRDGKLLSMRSRWGSEGVTVMVASVDPESEEAEDLITIPTVGYSSSGSMVYSEKLDALYYIMNGELYRIEGMDPSTNQAVSDMPLDSYSQSAPILTEDGLFIASNYETVVRRNTDPTLRAEKRLKVQNQYNQSVDSAYYAFTNKHGDIEVVLTQQVEDVVQAMMNRSPSVDVYCLYASSAEYSAVFTRGYMAELTGSETIASVVNNIYPAFKDWCVKDGEIVALPIELYFNSRGYSPKAFEKIGLTEEDIPTTWIELYEMLEPLTERLKDYPDVSLFEPYYSKEMLKRDLFSNMLQDYMVFIGQPGNEFKFDTPLFRALMDAYLAIDFDALGLPEDDEEASTKVYAVRADGGMGATLFSSYADISARTYALTSDQKPLLLALSEDVEPAIMGELCVVFVNPFSEHREDAIAFVEEIANSLDDVLRIHILPTENEPVLDPYYDTTLKSYDDMIATAKAQLEAAPEDDKKAYEDMVTEYEGYRKEYEDNYKYAASAESIAQYRTYADRLKITPYLGLGRDNAQEFYTLVSQFTDGQIDADAFIKNIDKKLQMMMLEGQ